MARYNNGNHSRSTSYGNNSYNYTTPGNTAQAPAVMMQPVRTSRNKPKKHHPVRNFLLTIFFLAIIFAGVLGVALYMSANRLQSRAQAIQNSYASCQTAFNKMQYQDMLPPIHAIADDLAEINTELKGWQWNVASYLPYYGTDVKSMQECADILDALVNQAYLPVLVELESFGNTDFSSYEGLSALAIKLGGETITARNLLDNAQNINNTCKVRTNAIPVSHFNQINQVVDMLKQAEDGTDKVIEQINVAINVVDGIGDYVSNSIAEQIGNLADAA